MGNKIRLKEELYDTYFDIENSVSFNSYNPFMWQANWKDFQKKALKFSLLKNSKFFLKFDIAKFYNNINLDLLYRKLLIDNSKK
ncbi:MAG: hypothetical protein UZ05_CHB002000189 [Chlorobi bacterium OLB5]|nr:MAG: hypothetical protein UZ05_CHB002000189 [Chlorobi bacterium OLB5]